jgi:dsDNA-binding SOS-regulon protein
MFDLLSKVIICICFLVDPDYGWDAHKVELSLWTAQTAERLGFNLKGKPKQTRKRKKTDSEASRMSKRQAAS